MMQLPNPFAPQLSPQVVMPPAAPTLLSGLLPNVTPATMLMLKNVPTTLDRNQLIKAFNERYEGQYDFLFLPGDFHTAGGAASRGFIFINFRSVKRAQQFTKDFHEKQVMECFPAVAAEAGDKVCEVQQARLG